MGNLTMVEQQQFIEHAKVHSNYGTSEEWVKSTLNKGIDVILIDWQGADQVRNSNSKSIFILLREAGVIRAAQGARAGRYSAAHWAAKKK